MDKNLYIGIGVLLAFYFLYKWFYTKEAEYASELKEVLTAEEYKVKGRFE